MKLLIALSLFVSLAAAGDISFNVAGLRVMATEWDKEANFAKLDRYARIAASRGAQVVATPEGFLEGYVANIKRVTDLTPERYMAVAEPINGPLLTRVRNLARELRIFLLIGFAEKREGKAYNSLVVFSPAGEIVTHYSKTHTARDEPFNTQGTVFPVVDTPLGRWGTLICMDRQLPETSRILAIKGAQLILVPAWGSHGEMNDTMMRTRAYENGVWVVFIHPRRCLFIDPTGKIIAQDTPGDEDQVVMAKIELDKRVGSGPIRFRRPEIYKEIEITR
ncbi:MAG: carbon-nitrogen hydrolase family protein [Bryobacterales bacterium]|nr:carbon-nitrogen hydrolase family protein [Bryobacterales bacterium]